LKRFVLVFIEAEFDAFGAIGTADIKFTKESMSVHQEIFLKSARTLFKKKRKGEYLNNFAKETI